MPQQYYIHPLILHILVYRKVMNVKIFHNVFEGLFMPDLKQNHG